MNNTDELAALTAKIARLEELTKLQSLVLISMWAKVESQGGIMDERYSKDIEENISKVVELFGVDADG